jgi:hypothetical protein
MTVGVDTPLDRRASSGASSCPENRVRFIRKYGNARDMRCTTSTAACWPFPFRHA